MYSSRSGIQQQPYSSSSSSSSRRSPTRGAGGGSSTGVEMLDSRSYAPSSYNDYRAYHHHTTQQAQQAPSYGAPPPDMRPPTYPTHTTQQYDARELQYGAYWSTSK